MANNIFRHTDVTHQLITQKEIAEKKMNLKIGNFVTFEFDNKNYIGEITNITKRTTVMVRDRKGKFLDEKGRHYLKFYIPIKLLRKIDRRKKI